MSQVSLSFIDIFVFIFYFIFIVSFGLFMARKEKNTTKEYFLAGDRLPWLSLDPHSQPRISQQNTLWV